MYRPRLQRGWMSVAILSPLYFFSRITNASLANPRCKRGLSRRQLIENRFLICK